jgi:TolB-like protein/Flp pilus assembly protein TadD
MSADVKMDLELEIVHVLFIDTVGYSKLLINEQREVLDELNRAVRSTNRFRVAESAGKLIRLPTGDGMALIFSDSPEAPLECAVEISRSLRDHPQLKLRMGIHSGPVSRVVDVNDRSNLAGAGVNIAQRVMSCADAGHILLSKRAADDLAEYRHWHPHLHEIGECEVKHGTKIGLVNFYTSEVGNPTLPARCKENKRRPWSKATIQKGTPTWTHMLVVATGAICALLILAFVFRAFFSRPTEIAPEKSIAVLPFENLSDDKQNAYFADGMQDEILADLAKVADLKVISRTSVKNYKSGAERNLPAIAKALGVAYALEGSVQRVGGRVRMRTQLIEARTDTHVWAAVYERDVADVFAIQSEIAETIAAQLKAKLSPQEKAAIAEPPTTDLKAYDYYLSAKTSIDLAAFNVLEKEKLLEAQHLLEQAIAIDPAFFLAHYQLARTHDRIYILGIDHTPARLALAEASIQNSMRLRPNSGEAHLALAAHVYSGYLDYDRARHELALAGIALRNEPLVFELTGYIDRRQNRWEDCIANLERALALDPRNFFILQQIALAYQKMRRFEEAATVLDQALMLVPNDPGTRVQRALVDLEWRADPKPLHATIQEILSQGPNAAAGIAESWLYLALCERDHNAAIRALAVMTGDGCRNEGVPLPHGWCEGVAALAYGDTAAARAVFTDGRVEIEKSVRAQPNYAEALCVLGLLDAGLGRKEEAIHEGRRAVELLPFTKDAINGPVLIQYLAIIYAWTGEKDLALDQIEKAIEIPGDVTYGHLRLHPYWDSLRGDPRFEKLVASLAPK